MDVNVTDVQRVPITPVTEPVTLAQVKTHLRVDFTDDDAYLTTLITQCRRAIENYCHISIVPATVTSIFTYQPKVYTNIPAYGPMSNFSLAYYIKPFELPYGPVLSGSVVVTTLDNNNNVQTLNNTNNDYYIRGGSFATLQIVNQVYGNSTVTYTAGYTVVPDDLLLAILNEIAFRYEERGDSTNRYASQNVGASEASQFLANPYKRYSWL